MYTGRHLWILRPQTRRCEAAQRIRLCRVRQHPSQCECVHDGCESHLTPHRFYQDAEDAIKELDGRDFMGDRCV